VTVEERGGKPEITSTPVRSPDEAASVAEQKAADGDLHAVDVDKPVKASFADPTDPLFTDQWSFNEVPYVDAWTTDNTQGAGVKVAVVDTGVMANHPDLSGQVLGGEYFLHDNAGTTQFSGPGGETDPNGHGTHVSGTIAALSDNGKGISGAAPESKILPVQVLCGDGAGWASDVAQGITWGVNNGAKVVNLSLGGGYSNAEEIAIQHARDNGGVVVAAGGNCSCAVDPNNPNDPNRSYPAAFSTSYSNVIAVAATTNDSPLPGHADYSTVASYIDISAPGGLPSSNVASVGVLSTVPFSAQEISDPSGYAAIAGTSMATPHVSASVALLMAAPNNNCTADTVKPRLKAMASKNLAPVTPNNPTNFANNYGAGLVDPQAAGASCT
jgi:serine protease